MLGILREINRKMSYWSRPRGLESISFFKTIFASTQLSLLIDSKGISFKTQAIGQVMVINGEGVLPSSSVNNAPDTTKAWLYK